MDRAELLHALSYDIELNWKNSPGKFKCVKFIETKETLQKHVFLKNRVSTPDLGRTKTHRKQFFRDLGWFQAGPHQKDVQTAPFKTKNDLVDHEL